jgi:predicted nucleic acid-binding protein
MRAVLDTSSLISEHRHWLWDFARRGLYEGVWSTFIVAELVRVRVEHSIARGVERTVYRRRINDLVHLLSSVLVVADYRSVSTAGSLRDPDDEPILAATVASGAGFIVSLNTRDFPADAQALGVRFRTPQDFLIDLIARHADPTIAQQAGDTTRLLP